MLCFKNQAMLLVAVMVLCGMAQAADEENPYKKAAVGQWNEYKTVSVNNGVKSEMTRKETVTAKDETSVTLKFEMSMAGNKLPASESKIDLTKKYEKAGGKVDNVDIEKLGEGDETITVGGKEYKCKWYNYKATAKIQGGSTSVTTTKTWICADVPLNGMVKMTSETDMKMPQMSMKTSSVTELIGSSK